MRLFAGYFTLGTHDLFLEKHYVIPKLVDREIFKVFELGLFGTGVYFIVKHGKILAQAHDSLQGK